MSDREKLIELIWEGRSYYYKGKYRGLKECDAIAKHLISNGVTVQKWVPVWEKMPAQEAQAHQNKYGEYAMFLTMIKGAVFPTALTYDVEKNSFFDFHYDGTVQYYEVTHWMPMPLPPKECE